MNEKIKTILSFLFVISLFFSTAAWANYSSQRVYVSPNGKLIFYISHKGYISEDGGNTWHTIIDAEDFSSVYGAPDNDALYLGGFEESVRLIPHNTPQEKPLSKEDEDFSYTDFDSVYVANSGNILFGGQDSDDDGAWLILGQKDLNHNIRIKWRTISIQKCYPGSPAYGPLNINDIYGDGKTVYLANLLDIDGNNGGICISKDDGQTWNIDNSFPRSDAYSVFAVQSSHEIYAAGINDNDSGLFVSYDAGNFWHKIPLVSSGLEPFITAVRGSSDGNVIYRHHTLKRH